MKARKSWYDVMQVVQFVIVIVFVALVLHFQEDFLYGGYVMCFGGYQVPLMAPYSQVAQLLKMISKHLC